MNFGHGEAGFGAWPRAKSRPVAEYCTVLSVSTPMALAALPMTAPASCADVVQTSIAASASADKHFLNMAHTLSPFSVRSRLLSRQHNLRKPLQLIHGDRRPVAT